METYLCIFVNWKQNDWTQLLPVAEFAHNNFKNASTGHTPFKLNCGYHFCIFFENKYDARSRSFSVGRLIMKLRELINVCCQNFLHA